MSESQNPAPGNDALGFLAGGGEMGARTRAFDWSTTPVGPVKSWPQSLKTVVRIMLASRYAMWLGWGPEFTFFYNDSYARMTLGPKHPWALGRSAREVWSEIWEDIGPRAESVVRTGEATWDEGLLLFLERQGFKEESYHSFSYSPVPDDDGGIGGMLCVVTEDTERTIGERRLRALRELATNTTEKVQSPEEACRTAARTLAGNPHDLPFTLIYLLDADQTSAQLSGAAGLAEGSPGAPRRIDLSDSNSTETGWSIRAALESRQPQFTTQLHERFGALSCGAWPEPPTLAVVLPLAKPGQKRLAGFVVAGISPRLMFDDGYKGFLDLLASQIATAIGNARAYEEERNRVQALAELDRAKTTFFSNVSHEFRTPLTLMLGPVDDLLGRNGELSPIAKDQLELVNRNGKRLLRLVNTLLEFSRIEAGRERAAYVPTDLAAFTTELASNFRSACERAGLQLTVDCLQQSEPVYVDREMWEKIVLNLLSNAFKFTFQGGIAVTLRQAGPTAELRVCDTGTGIAAEELPRLFERFHRIESSQGRTHEGTGIGLALVQELVKLHGGSINAESAVGQGTTFIVSIPLGSEHLPSAQIGKPNSASSTSTLASPYVEEALRWLPHMDGEEHLGESELSTDDDEPLPSPYRQENGKEQDERPRVLVADDNSDMRQYITRLLAKDFRIEAVPNGETALAIAREQPPDLILTDVMMPRLDGIGLLRELRADPLTQSVPVIMLSARAGEESRVEGIATGADDYLVKPFSARELVARVSAQLQMARLRQEASESLRESAERLRSTLSAARMVAWHWDVSNDCLVVSETAGRVFGLSPGSTLETSKQGFGLLHPDDRERHRAATRKAIRERGKYIDQFRMIRPDNGQVIWLEERGHAVTDASGKTARLVGLLTDITEQKLAEERERRLMSEAATANAHFRAFFEQGALFAGIMHVDGTIIEPNRLSLEACGYTREQVVGKLFWECPWWNRSPTLMEQIREASQLAAAGEIFRREMPYYVADGSQRMVDLIILPVRNETGSVMFLAPTGTDITDRKRAEEGTRKRSEQLRLLAEVATRLNAALDVNSIMSVVTEEARSIIGSHQAVTRFSIDDNWAQVINAVSLSDKYASWRRYADQPDGSGVYSLVCSTNKPMRLTQRELEQHPAFNAFGPHAPNHPPLRDWLAAPMVGRNGRNIGLIQLSDKYEGSFSAVDEAILVQLAQMASVAIENARLVESLRETDRRKDEFLATLAHELRNPLAPIRSAVQFMSLISEPNPQFEQVQGLIERQLAHMVRLVDDLMDVSRITRGKIELRRERLDVAAVVQSAVETSRPIVDAGKHTLNVTLAPQPVEVIGDLTRLAQVIANLMNNSAKYTPEGGQISVRVEREHQLAVIRVSDNGMGISAEMLPKVFDMFTQVNHDVDRSQGGLGIGLTLVKQLVEMHGGTVEARSQGAAKGSEFIVRLPITEGAESSQEPVVSPQDAKPKQVSPRRILVADDNRDAAESLAMLLRLSKNEVRIAYDGPTALEIAKTFHPDVVLLDLGMPGMSGYDVARRIRQTPDLNGVLLVAQTGWGQDGDRRLSSEAGFDAHLVKPVDFEAVQQLMATLSD